MLRRANVITRVARVFILPFIEFTRRSTRAYVSERTDRQAGTSTHARAQRWYDSTSNFRRTMAARKISDGRYRNNSDARSARALGWGNRTMRYRASNVGRFRWSSLIWHGGQRMSAGDLCDWDASLLSYFFPHHVRKMRQSRRHEYKRFRENKKLLPDEPPK